MNRFLISLLILPCLAAPAFAADMEITPFRTINQSPLTQIFGLPAETGATVTPQGHFSLALTQDIANDFALDSLQNERIHLDGESYRWTASARYGIADGFEAGMEIPYILYGGGIFDNFIEGWHKFFGFPNEGRPSVPRDRLSFTYVKDGVQKLTMNHAASGIGDISLTGAMRLYDSRDEASHDSLALRASLKLPSGDSAALRGSGSTDVALLLCGSSNSFTEWGTLGAFGSLGGMAMTDGNVLRDQQRNLVGLGTVGVGWGPAEWISFKFQVNWNTPFYRDSSLAELSQTSLMLVSGGALKLPGDYLLDIGVSEDLAVSTAPDVALHLGLSKRF
ncbi:MAG TPA: DUF3187 family protein [Desulfuromonadaceae bacterium]